MNKTLFTTYLFIAAILFDPVIGQPVFGADQWETKSLTIALIPEKNESEQLRRYRYISSYLADKLGIRIRLDLVPYGQITENLTNGKAQAGFFGSFGYVIAHKKIGIIPLVRPVWLNGTSTYAGYLVVRKDSEIRSVSDMANKKLVLVSKNTTAGYVFPKAYFLQNEVANVESYFSKVVFSGNHENTAWAVYTGEADVGALKNHIYNALKRNDPDFAKKMMVLAESKSVPSNSFAVNPDLEPGLGKKIQEILLGMHLDTSGRKKLTQFGAEKFIVTTDEDYQPCYTMLKNAEIELSQHKCPNK